MAQNELVPVGFKASLTKTVTEQDVIDFARVSEDRNPLHMDAAYAGKTRFKQRIAHGALTLSLISAVIGTKVAGPNGTTVYLGQNVKFLKPVFFGDTITAECQVIQARPEKRLLTLACRCVNQKGEEVVTGEATILVDPMPFMS